MDRESRFSSEDDSSQDGGLAQSIDQRRQHFGKREIPSKLKDVRVSSSHNPDRQSVISKAETNPFVQRADPPYDTSDSEEEAEEQSFKDGKSSKINTQLSGVVPGKLGLKQRIGKHPLKDKKDGSFRNKNSNISVHDFYSSDDDQNSEAMLEGREVMLGSHVLRASVIEKPLDTTLSLARRPAQPNQGKPRSKGVEKKEEKKVLLQEVKFQEKQDHRLPYDTSDQEQKSSKTRSSKQSFKIQHSQTITQLTETRMPNYAYESQEVLNNSYLLPQVVQMSREETNITILYCGHYLREKDIKLYSKKPGEVECPICKVVTQLNPNESLKTMDKEKSLIQQSQFLRKLKHRNNKCDHPKCKTPKSNDLAYIIEKQVVICKDCLFENEMNTYSWIGLDHLPAKLEQQFRNNQEFFEKKAKMLERQCAEIREVQQQIKRSNEKQEHEFNRALVEAQRKIDQRQETQATILKQGKQKFLDKLRNSARNVEEHSRELRNKRKQLEFLLHEIKRPAREIPSRVKTGLDIKKKIEQCRSLRDGEKIAEIQIYQEPILKQKLNFDGLVKYHIEMKKVNQVEDDDDESIWSTYIGDLQYHSRKYEDLKKDVPAIGHSSILER